MTDRRPLVSTQWLADHLQDNDLRVIDASWRLPGHGEARDDYLERHIPGAVFFDIDIIADRETHLPHMLPSSAVFEEAVSALGVSSEDRVVIYDDAGIFSAPRVWWTFQAMGRAGVSVLDGGLPKWRAEGRPVTAAPSNPAPARFKTAPFKAACANHADIRKAILHGGTAIADARPEARFHGRAPEPRDGLRPGAMPGAVNIPFQTLLSKEGAFLEPDLLRTRFTAAGLDLDKPIITTCGSGVTAAVLSLALDVIGHRRHSLYDGSWAEWGGEEKDPAEFPVITEREGGQQTP